MRHDDADALRRRFARALEPPRLSSLAERLLEREIAWARERYERAACDFFRRFWWCELKRLMRQRIGEKKENE